MSRSHLFVLPAFVTLLAACGGPSGGEVKSPTPEGSGTAAVNSPAPTSTASAAPEGTSAPQTKAPASDKDGPYDGANPGKAVALTGEEAWTLGPYPNYSDQLASYKFVRSEGTRNVFHQFASEDEFSMPAAFTFKPKAQKVKKGDKVFATIVTSGVCSRVTAVKDDKASIAFYWGDKLSTRDEVSVENLLVLDGTLAFGAPVIWEEGEDAESRTTEHGHLVYKDDKDAYLTFNKKVPAKDVRPVNVNNGFKAGEKVLASPFDVSSALQPGTVVKMLDDGLAYEVKLDDDPKVISKVSYCDMIPAPKPAKKK